MADERPDDDKPDAKSDDDQQDDSSQGQDKKDEAKPKARWPWIVAAVVVAVFVVVVLLIILLPHENVKTDDAYVTGHYAMVAPRVGGQIATVDVDDNQPVRAGQLLATIDDRDLRTTLDQATANLAADRARVAQAEAQVARQPSQIRQARAQVASNGARLGLSDADAARYADLARTGAGTFQQHQQADTDVVQQRASLEQARAGLDAQRHTLDALVADRSAAEARVKQDLASLRQAKLNLGYTRIVAPITGTVSERTVQVGNFVAPGAPILMLVPLSDVYVMANYRELELRHMRPGQYARIHVDAYDIDLRGHVASLPAASGATFSPLPPSNSTGNFTKIVQRLPVKIVVDRGQPLARLLRAGMSVEVWVDTNLDDVVAAQRHQAGRVTAP
ncbi:MULTISPECIES: HlyD family secretion protein [unclassified Sphingomonas]|uniref:HlyD family secretion protein n=1 Tax=unclassified Sphingomonas TaxID=196159 RepID=UPI00226AE221|nr:MULTISPECIES: HlyD family secretion protein [unclassified Sphingomonas]